MNKTLCGSEVLLAAQGARIFLRRHGDSLSEILQVISGDRGLDLFCEADSLLDLLSPDPELVGKAIHGMRDLLAEADTPDDRYVTSLRWHGARLSEIAAKLPE